MAARSTSRYRPRGRSKFNNRKTWTADGLLMDSAAEATRYEELRLQQQAGVIANLEHHHRYPLSINGLLIAYYEADFDYDDLERGSHVVEDVKGVKTDVYQLKKKMLRALYGIEIVEIAARRRAR